MKQGNTTTRIVVAILFIGIVIYFCIYAARGLRGQIATTVAYTYEVDDGVEAPGLLVREESVLPEQTGIVSITVEEGEKVGRGQQVAVLFSSAAAQERAQEIRTLEMEARQLEYAITGAGIGDATTARLDASIGESIVKLRAAAEEGDLTSLEDGVLELKSGILKREYTYGEGNVATLASQLSLLRGQLNDLRQQAGADTVSVSAPVSGIFSARADGYEALLTPKTVFGLTPSDVDELVKRGEQETAALGKLITSSRWYFVSALSEGDTERLYEGQLVNVSFSHDWSGDVSMRVESISDAQDGRVTVVFSSTRSLSDITLLRRQTVDIVFERQTGVRVPKVALRVNEEGVPGVYCAVGQKAEFKPARVISEGDDYYVLAAAVEDRTSLRAGDEVITSATGLYDGKVIRH